MKWLIILRCTRNNELFLLLQYIDGRKVVINDTFYAKETEFGTSVYSVRVVDFSPFDDEKTSTTNDREPELEVESVDSKTENKSNDDDEIDKGSPEELGNNDSENENEINRDIDDVEVKIPSDIADPSVV